MIVKAADYVVKMTGGIDQRFVGLTSAYERLTEMWTTDIEGPAPMVSVLMAWMSVFRQRARGPRG